MKQNYIEKKAESQHREYINNEPSGSFNHSHEVKQKSIYKNDYLVGGLMQNTAFAGRSKQGAGSHFAKAPPGRAREPGAARGHPPAFLAEPPDQTHNIPAPSPLSFKREGPGVSQNIKIQLFNKNSKFNLLQTFNF